MCLRRCVVTESPAGPRYSLRFSERRREYVSRRIEIAVPSFGCEPRFPPFCVAAFRFGRKWAAEPQEEREVMGRLLFISDLCPETLGVRYGVHSSSDACSRDTYPILCAPTNEMRTKRREAETLAGKLSGVLGGRLRSKMGRNV